MCIITLAYAVLALCRHKRLISSLENPVHSFAFLRAMALPIILTFFFLYASIFRIYAHVKSAGGLLPWNSWSQVHNDFSQVNIVGHDSAVDLLRIEIEWWTIPVSTLTLIIFTFVGMIYGGRDETLLSGLRSVGRWFNFKVLGRSTDMESFVLDDSKLIYPHIILQTPPTPTPLDLNKSAWDDTLHTKLSSGSLTTKQISKPKLSPISSDLPPSPSSSDTDSDMSFINSTLQFVNSPTGRKALGLPPAPPAESVDPTRLSVVPPPISSSQASSSDLSQASSSLTNSLLSGPWPEPPRTLPMTPLATEFYLVESSSPETVRPPALPRAPSPAHARPVPREPRSRSISSITTSLASSTISTHGYIYDPGLFCLSESPHQAPFENAGIPAPSRVNVGGNAAPGARSASRGLRKMKSKDSFVQGGRGGFGMGMGRTKGDEGVYMTVVQETV
ncbi:hypothetical protein NLI96_g3882 [Meripilus lineatus]|uniref:Pheromone receptor n=1 Tax=Meripilus lineatus TaxID=2056292 RepID=A0AAD5YIJ3_9APHY|nr:hypothetical protein NLI96_g3882 [Physisporinus lineatus]